MNLIPWLLPVCLCLSVEPAPAQTNVAVAPAPVVADAAADQEYRALLELDDQAEREINTWLDAAEKDPAGQDPVRRAGLKLKMQQRLEPVGKAYEAFLQKHPGHVLALIAYASYLRDVGRDAEAIQQLEKARDLDPANPAIWNNLGNFHGENGRAVSAFQCYLRALELKPGQPTYLHNYARNLYLYQAEAAEHFSLTPAAVIAKAQALLREALEKVPQSFAIASDLAQTYYAVRLSLTGDAEADLKAAAKLSDEALQAWQNAMRLARDQREREGVRLHYARIQVNIGRFREARDNLSAVTEPSLAATRKDLEEKLAQAEARKTGGTNAPPAKP